MKKFVFIATVIALVGCSKEAEFELHQAAKQAEQMSVDGSFDVGTVDANGDATITYDVSELKELCACSVSEDDANNLSITNYGGNTYYLTGVGSSQGSFTTFSVTLSQEGDVLSWVDNAEILTCETTASTPCHIDVQGASTYTCSNQNGSCGQTVIGGDNGAAYADCEHPWLIRKSGGK